MEFKIIRPTCKDQLRNVDICIFYLSGNSLKECGIKYGISRERSRQIIYIWMRCLLQKDRMSMPKLMKLRTDSSIELINKYKEFLVNKGVIYNAKQI